MHLYTHTRGDWGTGLAPPADGATGLAYMYNNNNKKKKKYNSNNDNESYCYYD